MVNVCRLPRLCIYMKPNRSGNATKRGKREKTRKERMSEWMNEWVNGTWKQKSIRPEIDGGNLNTNWIGTNVVNIIITIFNVWVCVWTFKSRNWIRLDFKQNVRHRHSAKMDHFASLKIKRTLTLTHTMHNGKSDCVYGMCVHCARLVYWLCSTQFYLGYLPAVKVVPLFRFEWFPCTK